MDEDLGTGVVVVGNLPSVGNQVAQVGLRNQAALVDLCNQVEVEWLVVQHQLAVLCKVVAKEHLYVYIK